MQPETSAQEKSALELINSAVDNIEAYNPKEYDKTALGRIDYSIKEINKLFTQLNASFYNSDKMQQVRDNLGKTSLALAVKLERMDFRKYQLGLLGIASDYSYSQKIKEEAKEILSSTTRGATVQIILAFLAVFLTYNHGGFSVFAGIVVITWGIYIYQHSSRKQKIALYVLFLIILIGWINLIQR